MPANHRHTPESRVLDALRAMLGVLPASGQRAVLAALCREIQPIGTPRAGDVLSAVAAWAPVGSVWTTADAKRAVASAGIACSAKRVFNALGYLTRRGHVQRIGYGRYKTVVGAPQRTPETLARDG